MTCFERILDPTGTGPFGLRTRSQAVDDTIDALFDHGAPRPNSNGRLQAALNSANNQVHGALRFGGQATLVGAQVTVAVLTVGGAAGVSSLAGGTEVAAADTAGTTATTSATAEASEAAPAAQTAAETTTASFGDLVRGNSLARTAFNTAAQFIRTQPAIEEPVEHLLQWL